jgi:hypothetical protein
VSQGELLPDEWGCSVVFQNLTSSRDIDGEN